MPDSGSGTGTPVTAVQTAYEAQPFFSAVWMWNNSGNQWNNHTIEARLPGGTVFSILEEPNDATYFGSESRFDLAAFILTTIASGLGTLTWQYYNGSWTQFVPGYNYGFDQNGAEGFFNLVNWTPLAFSAGTPHPVAPPDTRARYWVRAITPGATTTSPTIQQVFCRPYAVYCTPTDVANQLQLDTDFSSSTNPTRNTVEDYIANAQSYIDYKTMKSWRINYVQDEEYAFNMSGFKLARRDASRITRLQVWTGSDWQTKTEGRQSDYALVTSTNMVYWTRYFLLPARMQAYNAPLWAWGAGEFEFPVRVSYFYGRDINTDAREARLIKDIAKKLAAADVIQNHDYSILLPSGVDNVRLEDKIRNWKEEIDERLESARGWTVF